MSPNSWVGLPGYPKLFNTSLLYVAMRTVQKILNNVGWDHGVPHFNQNKLGNAIPILAVVVFPCTTSMVSTTTTTTTIKTYLTWLHTLIMYLDSVYPKLCISTIGIHDDQSIFASCWQSSLVLLVIQPLLLLLL